MATRLTTGDTSASVRSVSRSSRTLVRQTTRDASVAVGSVSRSSRTLGRQTTEVSSVSTGSVSIDHYPLGRQTTDATSVSADGRVIPTGGFKLVTVEIVDEHGEPIPEGDEIVAEGLFPTAAPITTRADGSTTAQMWLIPRSPYNFYVTTGTEPPKDDQVLRETDEKVSIDGIEKSATVEFEPASADRISVGRGAALRGD